MNRSDLTRPALTPDSQNHSNDALSRQGSSETPANAGRLAAQQGQHQFQERSSNPAFVNGRTADSLRDARIHHPHVENLIDDTDVQRFKSFAINTVNKIGRDFKQQWAGLINQVAPMHKQRVWSILDEAYKSLLMKTVGQIQSPPFKALFNQHPNQAIDALVRSSAKSPLAHCYIKQVVCVALIQAQVVQVVRENLGQVERSGGVVQLLELVKGASAEGQRQLAPFYQEALHCLSALMDPGKVAQNQGSTGQVEAGQISASPALPTNSSALLPSFMQRLFIEHEGHLSHFQRCELLDESDGSTEGSAVKSTDTSTAKTSHIYNVESNKLPGDRLVNIRYSLLQTLYPHCDFEDDTVDLLDQFDSVGKLIETSLKRFPFDTQHEKLLPSMHAVTRCADISTLQLYYLTEIFSCIVGDVLKQLQQSATFESAQYSRASFKMNENNLNYFLCIIENFQNKYKPLTTKIRECYQAKAHQRLFEPNESLRNQLSRDLVVASLLMSLFSKEVKHQLLQSALVGFIVNTQEFSTVNNFVKEDLKNITNQSAQDANDDESEDLEGDEGDIKTTMDSYKIWSEWIVHHSDLQVGPKVTFFILELLDKFDFTDKTQYRQVLDKANIIQSSVLATLSGKRHRSQLSEADMGTALAKLNIDLGELITLHMKSKEAATELTNIFHIIKWRASDIEKGGLTFSEPVASRQGSIQTLFDYFKQEAIAKLSKNTTHERLPIIDINEVSEKIDTMQSTLKLMIGEGLESEVLEKSLYSMNEIRDRLLEAGEDVSSIIYANVLTVESFIQADHALSSAIEAVALKGETAKSDQAMNALLEELALEEQGAGAHHKDKANKKKNRKGSAVHKERDHDQALAQESGKSKRKRGKRSKKQSPIQPQAGDLTKNNEAQKSAESPKQAKSNEPARLHEQSALHELTTSPENDALGQFTVVTHHQQGARARSIKEYRGMPHVYMPALGDGRVSCITAAKLERSAMQFSEPFPGGEQQHRFLFRQCQHSAVRKDSILQVASLQYHYDKHVVSTDKHRVPAEMYALAGSLLTFFIEHFRDTGEWLLGEDNESTPTLKYRDAQGKCKYTVDQFSIIYSINDKAPSKSAHSQASVAAASVAMTPKFISLSRADVIQNVKLTFDDLEGVIQRSRTLESDLEPVKATLDQFGVEIEQRA